MLIRTCGTLLLICLVFAMSPAPALAGPTLLFDSKTGRVLYAQDADRLWYPASLTKIMTAYVIFDAIRSGQLSLETKLISSEAAALEPPSKIGLPIGTEMPLDLGLRALIIKSANDVAIMLAEAASGSKEAFAVRMNETAKRLGMTRTHFINPNGLPVEGQYTTARDLARLSIAVLRDFPQHAHYWAMPTVTVGKYRLRSHNSLLRNYEGADGIKTGFICDSGFNIVASATRDGRKLVAIVLGESNARDRGLRAKSLLEHGFMTNDWKSFLTSTTLDTLPQSTTSSKLISIRADVQGWSCGNRTAARQRARVIRQNKLLKGNSEKLAAQNPAPPKQAPNRATNKTQAVPPPTQKTRSASEPRPNAPAKQVERLKIY